MGVPSSEFNLISGGNSPGPSPDLPPKTQEFRNIQSTSENINFK